MGFGQASIHDQPELVVSDYHRLAIIAVNVATASAAIIPNAITTKRSRLMGLIWGVINLGRADGFISATVDRIKVNLITNRNNAFASIVTVL